MMLSRHNVAAGFRAFVTASAFVLLADSATAAEQPLFAPAPGSPIAVSGMPGNVAMGDVNKDGKLDLLVANRRGITVLLGQGDGRFQPAAGSPVQAPERASEMLLCDLDGDQVLDLALGNHDSYEVTLLRGDGTGGFSVAANSPLIMKAGRSPHTHGLHAGDLNGDGNIDLVTVNNADNDVSVAFGDGKGGFTRAAASFPVGPSPYPGAVADLNGDGLAEIIATSTGRHSQPEEQSTRALTVLFGDGHGGFRVSRVPLKTILPWYVAVGDLSGDGKPDLAVSHAERKELSVLIGDGKGGFTETAGSPFDLGHPAWHLAIMDANGDRKPDIVAAAGEGIRVMLGDGRGGFRAAPGSPFGPGKGIWQLAIGDLNGDGKQDAVASNLESDCVTVLLGR